MKLKGLVWVHGSPYYQRSVPKDLLGHPTFGNRKLYKKPLGSKLKSDEEILHAWQAHQKAFETLIFNLRKINTPLIDARQLAQQAVSFLKAHGFSPGQRSPSPLLSDADNKNIEQLIDHEIDISGMLDDARQFHYQVESGEIDSFAQTPTYVQIADEAWRLLNTPKAELKNRTVLLSDCLDIYAEKKGLNRTDRQDMKTLRRWNAFLDYVGDCELTNDQIHDALDRYVAFREKQRKETGGKSPSSSTIQKEVDMACAIINLTAKLKRLPINIVKPEIEITDPKVRETLSPSEILEIVQLAQDTNAPYYSPWKELAILLMAQTSCIASELQRTEKTSMILDGEVPAIKITGKTKTACRKRTIPLVYQVERIRELVEQIDPDSPFIFGEVASKSESNISKQLKSIIERVNPNATAYSFRHSFKNNAQVNDVDSQDIAYLGGWSGSSMRVNEIMMNYGKKGLESKEMAVKLQRVMKRINRHLLELESANNNVYELRA